MSANSLTTIRLDAIQTTLGALLTDAQDIRKTLINAQPANSSDPQSLMGKARQALGGFIAKLNAADAGGYIFAGANSDQAPIKDYFASTPAPAKVALDSAFSAAFGFSQSSPSAQGITSTQMQGFLSGAFDALFSSASWKTDWSTASDKVQRSQISLSVAIDSSVSANEPALKQRAKAYTMLSDTGLDRLPMTALHHDGEGFDLPRGQTEATPDAFARCIERLEEVIVGETAILRSGGRIDYDRLNQRKSHALLEFMRASRNATPESMSQSAERVAGLRNLLAENARLLEQRLRAAEEITTLIVRDLRDRESDGTYSIRSPRAPQR